MVFSSQFFFSHLKRIRHQYKSFFDAEETDQGDQNKDPELDNNETPSSAAARFFFQLTYQLSKEDITKVERINESNVYLCLNVASLMKDRVVEQENQMRKLKAKTPHR